MTWARSLPRPLRRAATWLVHATWNTAGELGAIGPDDARGRRFGAMGRGACLLFPQGAIYNERYIHVGAGTIVGPFACLTAGMAPGQEMPTDPVVRIGSRCVIGRGSHIVGHWSIEIGDDIQTGPYVYITDQNHGYENPDEVVHTQWPSDVPVHIGTGSWLGTGVVILPGTELGRNVVVGAGAVVRGVFPDHSVIAGVPARVVRRYVPGSGWVRGAAADPEASEGTAVGTGSPDPRSGARNGADPFPTPVGTSDPSDAALTGGPGFPRP